MLVVYAASDLFMIVGLCTCTAVRHRKNYLHSGAVYMYRGKT